MPPTEDPVELQLRSFLDDADLEVRSRAALLLSAAHRFGDRSAARRLLLLAVEGPPLTCARARVRLARLALDTGDQVGAREQLEEARDALREAASEDASCVVERLTVLVDVAVAFGLAGQHQLAVDVLHGVIADLRKRHTGSSDRSEDGEQRRALFAFAHLRLGQIQMESDPTSADASLRLAARLGAGSVAARAALERGWLLEHRKRGYGPEIEEQYRKAADFDDPVNSPMAKVSLGDLLWRNGNATAAEIEWRLAGATGDADIAGRVQRRFDGTWLRNGQHDDDQPPPQPLDPAAPVQGVVPQTALGRIASGRAADRIDRRCNVVVVGAGTGGHYLLPGLVHDYNVLGFVDDNPAIRRVGGIPVLGSIDELEDIISDRDVQQVLLAIPTATGQTRRRVLQAALRCRVEVRTLPSMFELRRGYPMVPQLRPVEVHETFGEFAWVIDRGAAGLVRGRRVAVVGAGSWVGRELARRIAHGQARHLLLVDEPAGLLLNTVEDLREHRDYLDCDARIVDCADEFSLSEVMGEFRPEIVFYCGGLDHMPAEVLPSSHAARANVQTAATAALAARASEASRFVMASATRAAHRACAFDMTKALAEHAALELAVAPEAMAAQDELRLVPDAPNGFRVSVLRIPNVWSRESAIVSKLTGQLADGGPIRVDSAAKRRFVTGWQAAEAMLQILRSDRVRGIHALACGEVVSIRELAERLIWINGLRSGLDLEILETDKDDATADTRLWGKGETVDASDVPGIVDVHQDQNLREDLKRRLEMLRTGLHGRSSTTVSGALDVEDPGTPTALSA